MEIRTLVEIVCALGFAVYFLWASGKIFTLGAKVVEREKHIAEQKKIVDDSMTHVTKLTATLTSLEQERQSAVNNLSRLQQQFVALQSKVRVQIEAMRQKITAMQVQQVSGEDFITRKESFLSTMSGRSEN